MVLRLSSLALCPSMIRSLLSSQLPRSGIAEPPNDGRAPVLDVRPRRAFGEVRQDLVRGRSPAHVERVDRILPLASVVPTGGLDPATVLGTVDPKYRDTRQQKSLSGKR